MHRSLRQKQITVVYLSSRVNGSSTPRFCSVLATRFHGGGAEFLQPPPCGGFRKWECLSLYIRGLEIIYQQFQQQQSDRNHSVRQILQRAAPTTMVGCNCNRTSKRDGKNMESKARIEQSNSQPVLGSSQSSNFNFIITSICKASNSVFSGRSEVVNTPISKKPSQFGKTDWLLL